MEYSPEHLIHKRAATRTCVRCVMDDTDPAIIFDDEGVCNHCHEQARRWLLEVPPVDQRAGELKRLVDRLKEDGRGKPYDCLIGLSGGVDSSMVAYELCKRGVRPLALHLDNGWNAEVSVRNVKNLVSNLGIDLKTHVLDWPEFRDLQLAFIRSGVINWEIPTDHAITALLFHSAKEHGVKYIISGSNLATEAIMPTSWGYDHGDWRHIRAIHKRYGTKRLSNFPRQNLIDWGLNALVRGIRFIPILNLIEFERSRAMELLAKDFGWSDYGPKHGESVFTRMFQCYFLPERLGIDKRKAHLSSMIGSGQLTRDEALQELEHPPYPEELLAVDLPFFRKKLGLVEEDIEELLGRPAVSHLAYPNNEKLFDRLGGLVAFARKRVKTI
jgi:N-acetyl sugar amidotransferase